jgi:polysaccharide chain length determinant protein (PEP-CTERM system associated)
MQQTLDKVLTIFRGAWRFHRLAILVAWVTCLLAWAVVSVLPDMYEARARVFVDTRTALKPVLQGLAIDQDVDAQINFVKQSLLSAPQLEKVAEATGLLDASVQSPQARLRVIDRLRTRITLTVQSAAEQGGEQAQAGTIYSIIYQDPSRARSLKIVETLLDDFVAGTLGGKREGSQNAQKFLQEQIHDYEQRLRASEDRLAVFKKNNVGLMPTQAGDYFTHLQTEIDAVNKAQDDLALAEARRAELARQLKGDETLAATAPATMTTGPNGIVAGTDTLSRIKETQAKIDDLLLRDTEKHPDVIALKETLVDLKQRRAAEMDALRRGDPNAVAASGAASNPVYQSIQLALNQADVEIASLKRQLADHRNTVSELRTRLDTMPQVEAEYARLNRDYDVTKAQYTAMVERLDKSKLGEEADTSGSIKFSVIDPPAAEFLPVWPKRGQLIGAGLVAGLALGGGLAYVLNLMRPVFDGAASLGEATGLPILGTITVSDLLERQRRRRRSYVLYAVSVLVLVVVGVVVLKLNAMGLRLDSKLIGLA